jgi:hypothetical protein
MARKLKEPTAADEATTAVVPQEAAAATEAASGPTPDPETGTEGQAATAGEGSPPPAGAVAADAPQPVPSLVIIGPKAGRRRAGRQFGPEPVTLAVSDLSEAEIAALTGDPALTVQTVSAPY